MDERVAGYLALFTALLGGEDELYVHDRQLTDPSGRQDVDDFTVRAGRDLACRAEHLGTGDTL